MIGICCKNSVFFNTARHFLPFKRGIFKSKKITSGIGIIASNKLVIASCPLEVVKHWQDGSFSTNALKRFKEENPLSEHLERNISGWFSKFYYLNVTFIRFS